MNALAIAAAPMDASVHAHAGPAVIRFAVSGLEPRVELALKSMLRLLASRIDAAWVYDPAQPQVLLLGSASSDAERLADGLSNALVQSVPIVWIGLPEHPTDATHHQLAVPLNVSKVEQVVGALTQSIKLAFVQAQQRAEHPTAAANSSLITQASVELERQLSEQASVNTDSVIRLKRWPSAALLAGNPNRVRLATLLMARGMPLQKLHRLSGLPWQDVMQFCHELQQAGQLRLVQVAQSSSEVAQVARTQPPPKPFGFARGLLDQIRNRLGFLAKAA